MSLHEPNITFVHFPTQFTDHHYGSLIQVIMSALRPAIISGKPFDLSLDRRSLSFRMWCELSELVRRYAPALMPRAYQDELRVYVTDDYYVRVTYNPSTHNLEVCP